MSQCNLPIGALRVPSPVLRRVWVDLQGADRRSLNSGGRDGECGRFASRYVCLSEGSLAKAKVMRLFNGCWLTCAEVRGLRVVVGQSLIHYLEIN